MSRSILASPLLLLLGTACSPLSPARDIVGTWLTEFPVTFHYERDYCSSGVREDYGTADLTVRLVIDPNDSGANDVWMGFTELTEANWTNDPGTSCAAQTDSGYDVIAGPYATTVSSSAIDFTDADGTSFTGSYTTDLLSGTLTHWVCDGVNGCAGFYTVGQELKFVKQ